MANPASNNSKNERSLHKSFKIVAIFANCVGLFPVDGTTDESPFKLRFRWTSPKTVFALLVVLLGIFRTFAKTFYLLHKHNFSLVGENIQRAKHNDLN